MILDVKFEESNQIMDCSFGEIIIVDSGDGPELPEIDPQLAVTSSDIKIGKKAINADGKIVTGTMPVHEYVDTSLTLSNTHFGVQEGYHKGCIVGVAYDPPVSVKPKAHEAVDVFSPNQNFLMGVHIEPATDAYNEGYLSGESNISNQIEIRLDEIIALQERCIAQEYNPGLNNVLLSLDEYILTDSDGLYLQYIDEEV